MNVASASLCRDAFVAPKGRVLLSADYAQMELRLMAHLSGDEALCAMLRDPLQDPFTLWASQWMLIPASQASLAVWEGHRRGGEIDWLSCAYLLSLMGLDARRGIRCRDL